MVFVLECGKELVHTESDRVEFSDEDHGEEVTSTGRRSGEADHVVQQLFWVSRGWQRPIAATTNTPGRTRRRIRPSKASRPASASGQRWSTSTSWSWPRAGEGIQLCEIRNPPGYQGTH